MRIALIKLGLLGLVIIGLIIWATIHFSAAARQITVSGYKTSPEVKMAMELYSAQKLTEAEAKYRSIVQSHPKDFVAWNGLGNVLREQNKAVEAESAYLKVISLNPRFEFVYRNLLTLYQLWPNQAEQPDKLRDFETLLTQVLKLKADSANILGVAVSYYQTIGDSAKAAEWESKLSQLPGKEIKVGQ